MNKLLNKTINRLLSGLNRASIQSCSRWSEEYRVMGKPFPGPWTFTTHPWLKEMHDSNAEINVGMKAAQMGFTETVLNICFYTIDILQEDVLYALPNAKPDAANFSASRFDAALSLSPHLSNLFSDVQNVGHKRAGSANMYLRGSQSESGFKNISTSTIILDELEEMNAANIALVFERASGQLSQKVWMISTPGIFNKGIHQQFLSTTQDHFFFKCPGCSKFIELAYPDNLVIVGEDETDPKIYDSYYQCKLCKKKLAHELKRDWLSLSNGSVWVPTFTNKNARGFHIPQLYSMTMPAGKFAMTHFKAQRDPAEEQQLYNSKMGMPHEVKGARICDGDIDQCVENYSLQDTGYHTYNTMGVDQGKYLDLTVTSWHIPENYNPEDINSYAIPRIIGLKRLFGLNAFDDLDPFMLAFNIKHCVLDANPERRDAQRFAARFPGRVSLCFYGNNVKGKVINQNTAAGTITVDRTAWLDTSLSRFRNKRVKIPVNRPKEFDLHLKNQVRRYKLDKNNNNVAYYESTGDDHFGHAFNYNELALPMSFGLGIVETISESAL